MKNKYEKRTTPLLHPCKEREYLCAEYYELYWGQACAEFKFVQGIDTYFFYSEAGFVEGILLFLSYLELPNPCPTLQRFKELYTNFDEAFDDWQEIEDKALFVDNLKQVSLENYIRLKRQKTHFNDRNIRLYQIINLAKSLIELVGDSTTNPLFLRYN